MDCAVILKPQSIEYAIESIVEGYGMDCEFHDRAPAAQQQETHTKLGTTAGKDVVRVMAAREACAAVRQSRQYRKYTERT